MEKKILLLFLIIILGFTAKPIELDAYCKDSKRLESKSAKSCCVEISKCCYDKNSKRKENKKEKKCEDKSGKVSYSDFINNYFNNAPFFFQLIKESVAFDIHFNNYQPQEITICDGFFFIWSPPNIS